MKFCTKCSQPIDNNPFGEDYGGECANCSPLSSFTEKQRQAAFQNGWHACADEYEKEHLKP